MAHPDEGYLIPDELWEGSVDPETGETVYPDDEFAAHRIALVRAQMQRGGQVARRKKPLEQVHGRADQKISGPVE
jgi:hypothetical protein